MKRRVGTGAAPGKVILFGEHAVVYGRPAIAAALGTGLGATVEADATGPVLRIPAWGRGGQQVRLERAGGSFESISRAFAVALTQVGLSSAEARQVAVTVDGGIPPGVGLGSSAAFSVAVLRALFDYAGHPASPQTVLAAAMEMERVFHGTPSGLDHTIVTHGGCARFQRGQAPTFDSTFESLPVGRPLALVVSWSPREITTHGVVARLRERRERYPLPFERLFDAIGEVTREGQVALSNGDLEQLGLLFDHNHGLLSALGVSTLANEQLVSLSRRGGAYGAKLTGAGGGGAVLALMPEERCSSLVSTFEREGFKAFATTIEATP